MGESAVPGEQAFLAEVDAELSHTEHHEDALAELSAAWEAGCRAWPAVQHCRADAFARALGRAVSGAAPEDWSAGLRGAQASDLYLALAAAAGDSSALREIDALLQTAASRIARRMQVDVDEAVQLVRVHLLAPSASGPPRLAQYQGRGKLAGWFRVVAARQLLNQRRAARADQREDDFVEPVVLTTPELAVARKQYQSVFAEALRSAFEELEPKHRSVLRASVIEGLGVVAIGQREGVHTATAARRLNAARAGLIARFRRRLGDELGDEAEVEQLLGMLHSRLELTEGTLIGRSPRSRR